MSELKKQLQTDVLAGGYESVDARTFQSALKDMHTEEITLSELMEQLENYANSEMTPIISSGYKTKASWWPSGHSHGCCGNYDGPCYFWHPICYVHDILCRTCQPAWFCLSGCVPDQKFESNLHDAEEPAVKIFTFIEDVL